MEGSRPIELPHKTWRVVEAMIDAAPEPISRSALIEKIWLGNHYIGEKALNQALWAIRRALADDARNPDYIRTLPGQGYQWIGPVATCSKPPTLIWHKWAASAAVLAVLLSFPATVPNTSPSTDANHSSLTNQTILASNGWRAYASMQQIVVENPQGCQLIIKTDQQTRFSAPVFSAGGEKIAFRVEKPDNCKLIIINLETQSEQRFDACPVSVSLPV